MRCVLIQACLFAGMASSSSAILVPEATSALPLAPNRVPTPETTPGCDSVAFGVCTIAFNIDATNAVVCADAGKAGSFAALDKCANATVCAKAVSAELRASVRERCASQQLATGNVAAAPTAAKNAVCTCTAPNPCRHNADSSCSAYAYNETDAATFNAGSRCAAGTTYCLAAHNATKPTPKPPKTPGPTASPVPDPTCATGVTAVNKTWACCPASCGVCAGEGCGQRPGGAACCMAAVLNSSCEAQGPPCSMTTFAPTLKPTKPPTKPKVLLSTLKNHSTAPKVAAVELKLNINQAAFLAQKGNLTAQLAKVAGVDPSRVEVTIVPAPKPANATTKVLLKPAQLTTAVPTAPRGALLAVQVDGDGDVAGTSGTAVGVAVGSAADSDGVLVSVRILPAVDGTQEPAGTAMEKLAGQPAALLSSELGTVVAEVSVQAVPTIAPSVLAQLAEAAAPYKDSGASKATACTSLALLTLVLPALVR